MNRKIISMSALTLALLGGTVLGISKVNAAPAHGQIVAEQVQAASQKDRAEGKERVGKAEPANEQAQEKNLPGGGHQDQGQADHQFEGIE